MHHYMHIWSALFCLALVQQFVSSIQKLIIFQLLGSHASAPCMLSDICCLHALLHLLVLHCIGNKLCTSISLSECVHVCKWTVHIHALELEIHYNYVMHVLQDMLYLTLLYIFTLCFTGIHFLILQFYNPIDRDSGYKLCYGACLS